jgi:hypothetical protein
MRLKFLLASLLLALLVLVACSSMELSREEAYGEQLPAGFNWREFAELNLDIRLSKAIVPFAQWNQNWLDSIRVVHTDGYGLVLNEAPGEGLGKAPQSCFSGGIPAIPCIRTIYLVPYIEEFTRVKRDANDEIVYSESGMGIKIAKKHFFWSEDKIEKLLGLTRRDAFGGSGQIDGIPADSLYKIVEWEEWRTLRKFILYGRQGEEMSLLDSISAIEDSDSALFYKNYVLSGKKNGMAYRVCKDNEKKTPKSEIDKDNYINNLFCADTVGGLPYNNKIYAIPGTNN